VVPIAGLSDAQLAEMNISHSTTNHSKRQWVNYDDTDTCGRPRHSLKQESIFGQVRAFLGPKGYNLQRQQTGDRKNVLRRYLDEFEVKWNEGWLKDGKMGFVSLICLIAEVHRVDGWAVSRG
jgi:hypothetical protein